jgi:hypothetical protein
MGAAVYLRDTQENQMDQLFGKIGPVRDVVVDAVEGLGC